MKRLTLALALFIASGTTAAFAQCGKNMGLTSSKTEHLNADGTIRKSIDETVNIELIKNNLTVTVNGNQIITGSIKSNVCDWKIPYKEGKTIYKAIVTEEQGDGEKNVTLTLTGKDGKLTLLYEMDGMPDQSVRVAVDNYTEKN